MIPTNTWMIDMEKRIELRILNPIWSEEEYRYFWNKDPVTANMLLYLTEKMDDDGIVGFDEYEEIEEGMQMRFATPGEYRYKQPIN